MRFILAVLLAVALLSIDSAPSAATRNAQKNVSKRTTDVDANDIIYDLTIPWPFHRSRTDSDGDGVPDSRDKCPDTPRGAVVDIDGCPIDSDGDGVPDGIDACPDTPKGATVDSKGCPMDSDGDGVYDGIDACPGTPKGATVDSKGCPIDSDGDGVPDGIDVCPDTPKGATVDAKGCPMDSDGDGVYDGIDRCPNTPRDLKVNEFGCPIERTEFETQLLDTGVIRAYNIYFEFDKSNLKPESHKVLDEIGTLLIQWPTLQIEIGGHTDSKGSDAYNQNLSEQRAKAVYDYLIKNFSKIDPANLTTKGYGEKAAIASNTTDEGRAKNRRVEFSVLNKETLKKEIETRGMEKK